jgi:predicted cupin superfamily sugar epimerase
VSPGFDFSDFELASRAQCLQQYPSAATADIIIKLTEGLP